MNTAINSLPTSWDAVGGATRFGKIAFHAVIFFIAFLILFLRRPDAILNAQFYCEDGLYWYADAYHFGWRCLLMPISGYLSSLCRMIGMFSLLFPFGQAPLVMNLCAIVAGILPIHIFLSSRFNSIPFNFRLLGSFLYLALPNSFELHATTTNIRWHLALAGCLILLASPKSGRVWQVFDFLLLALVVLDGPLGILLIPIAFALRWLRKDRRYDLALAALIPGALLQSFFLFVAPRRPAPNGASIERFIHILGGQVFLSSLLGVRTLIQLFQAQSLFAIDIAAILVGLAILGYALRRGPMELKLFLVFAAAVFGLGLLHPLATTDGNHVQWEQLQVPGCGNRYYFFPMLAFLVSLFWMVSTPPLSSKVPRYAALALLFFLPIGIVRDWQYRPFDDLHFHEIAADFQRAPSGTQFVIPLNPGVTMQLTKR
jgi:hypothetical protein